MVSIITVNYNGYAETVELIQSFKKYEDYPFEIIVVDNASVGEDVKRLKDNYSDIVCIASPINLGFSGGNNLGYKYARGNYILFINNDTTIDKPILKKLITRIESSERIGLISPKIKFEYAPEIIQYAGRTSMHPIRMSSKQIGNGERDRGQYDQAKITAFAHGACMFTTKRIIEKVGVMTDVFFLFFEEFDWTIQIQQKGYEVWYDPTVYILHKESMTIKPNTPPRIYYLTRSRILFIRRNCTSILQKGLTLSYQLMIVLPIHSVKHIFQLEFKRLSAFWKGLYHGFIDPKE